MQTHLTPLLLLLALILLTTGACRNGVDGRGGGGQDDDDGGPGMQLECNDGFTLSSDGNDCLCPPGKVQFGLADCEDFTEEGFTYASMDGCFDFVAGFALRMPGEEAHSVIYEGTRFTRYRGEFVYPTANVGGIQTAPLDHLRRELSAGVDSIIFNAVMGAYWGQIEGYPDALGSINPSWHFKGKHYTESGRVVGTMYVGHHLDYWKIQDPPIYSCEVVFEPIGN